MEYKPFKRRGLKDNLDILWIILGVMIIIVPFVLIYLRAEFLDAHPTFSILLIALWGLGGSIIYGTRKMREKLEVKLVHISDLSELMLAILNKGKNAEIQEIICDTISKNQKAHSLVGSLQVFLTDERPWVRKSAAYLLGRERLIDASSLQPLIDRATNDVNMDVRLTSIQSLGDIKDSLAVEALTKIYYSSNNNILRHTCIISLTKIRDAGAINTLEKALEYDSSEIIRLATINTLKDAHAISALEEALSHDSSGKIRLASIGALKDFKAVSSLEKALKNDSSEAIRLASIRALTEPNSWPTVVSATLEDPSENIRSEGFIQLNSLGYPLVAELALKALENDKHAQVRKAAADILGNRQELKAVSTLVRSLKNDPSIVVRIGAARALGRIGDSKAVSALKEIMDIRKFFAGGQIKELRLAASEALIYLYRPVLVAVKIQSDGFRVDEDDYIGVTVQNRGFKAAEKGGVLSVGGSLKTVDIGPIPSLKPDGECQSEIRVMPLKKGIFEEMITRIEFSGEEQQKAERLIKSYVPIAGQGESKIPVVIFIEKVENMDVFNLQISKNLGRH